MSNNAGSKKSLTGVFNFLSFIAISLIGVALVIALILHLIGVQGNGSIGQLSAAIKLVAQIISYILVSYYSFLYVKTKRHWAYWVVWAVALVLIIVSLIFIGI